MSAQRPLPGEPRQYHFPEFHMEKLECGSKVIVAPVNKLPIVTVLAVVNAGSEWDPEGREGVAQLTAALLSEGTSQRSGVQLTEDLELLGSALVSSADWDSAVVSATVMRDNLAPVVKLLGEALREPTFPEREFQRVRNERLAEILQSASEPRTLADELFSAVLYDGRSRYGRPMDGTESSVSAMEREELVEFHRARYSPANTTFIVVGDVQSNAVVRLLNDVFSGWSGAPRTGAGVSPQQVQRQIGYHLGHREGAAQSEVRIGHVGLPRAHPDYLSVTVMNAVLGGLFSSRINLNLRERHGYTYGAFSHFDWRHGAGPFEVGTAVKTEATAAAIGEVLREVKGMQESEISESELALARDYLVGVFPIRFETTAAIAGALSAMAIYDLPHGYFNEYRDRVAAVTVGDVLRVAREHLRPDELQVVVVGDADELRASMQELAGEAFAEHDAAAVLRA